MDFGLLLIGFIILICILLDRYLNKLPIPSLIIFLGLGMIFGQNGPFHIVFNDYRFVSMICPLCLLFIMFSGGFSTNIKTAKPILSKTILLSTIGVLITAFVVCLSIHFLFKLSWVESLLIGALISSTDAGSIVSILKSKKLALKNHTDSLLEVESASNDPVSYTLMLIALVLLTNQNVSIPFLIIKQIGIGLLVGILIPKLAIFLLNKNFFESQQSRTIFLIGTMIVAFSLPNVLDGNGYLSVYLCGVILGNSNLPNKRYFVQFFDVVTHIGQVIIFFLLGLLVVPLELGKVLLIAFIITLVLTFLARPLACFSILAPYKTKLEEIILIAFAGMRGSSPIVYAITIVLSGADLTYNIYNLVFCVVLLSISIQGSLFPFVAKKLQMIDENADISKTFNDYQEDSDVNFIKIHLDKNHPWCNKYLKDIPVPNDLLIVSVIRKNETIIPKGNTLLLVGDLLVIAAKAFEDRKHLHIMELPINTNHYLAYATLKDARFPKNKLVILIKRGLDTIIPEGKTLIYPGDILVVIEALNDNDI
ncbi:MAG: potassium/proton antiporter [Bacilli bacterium]|nr:potassium/proton antiporter [Bacilli bacterium]